MAAKEIRIPDIGDAEDVEVVEICVAVGDEVALDGPLIVIESDKASMEVPSPEVGRIARIDVKVGDRVKQGQLIAMLDTTAGAAAPVAEPRVEKAAVVQSPVEKTPMPKAPTVPVGSRRLEVRLPDVGEAKGITVVEIAVAPGAMVKAEDLLLVVESDKASMEIPSPAAGRIAEVAVSPGSEVAEGALLVVIEALAADATDATPNAPAKSERPAAPVERVLASQPESLPANAPATGSPAREGSGASVYAGPAVRRLARELGVTLLEVRGSGMRGRVVKEDVQKFVKARMTRPPEARATGNGIPPMPVLDFAKFGPIELLAQSRIRQRGAANLHRSWLNVPHVTQHDEADVTELEQFRASLKSEAASRGVKLTPLAFVFRALVATLKNFPTFNASLDAKLENLILKRYYHIGFAVDTPAGLVVPVIKDADQKGLFDLAREVDSLSTKAREGKLAPADLSGGSFSVSSLGPIGGTGFTPIVNAPEVAILGVSRMATKPHWTGTAFEPRQFLPISLSYDHRAINGAEAGRFVTAFCSTLSDLRRALL